MTITPDISVAIAFVIFIVLVVWKGTKKLTAGLDQRAEAIRKQLDETQNLREEAKLRWQVTKDNKGMHWLKPMRL